MTGMHTCCCSQEMAPAIPPPHSLAWSVAGVELSTTYLPTIACLLEADTISTSGLEDSGGSTTRHSSPVVMMAGMNKGLSPLPMAVLQGRSDNSPCYYSAHFSTGAPHGLAGTEVAP